MPLTELYGLYHFLLDKKMKIQVSSDTKLNEVFVILQHQKKARMKRQTNEYLAEGDIKWDTLLASDEAQRLLETMADEVSNEILAGRAKPMAFTDNRQLIHG